MRDSAAERALLEGTIAIDGRLPWSSNYTFLVSVRHEGAESKAIYKPGEGEQPLWDFPPGLFKREVAAYRLAAALGWPKVPETVLRNSGPFGVGSLQRFVPANFEEHYFTMVETEALQASFLEIATFDIVANNADRKGGHCLEGDDGNVWAIDHGLCFNVEPKLRTVIWDFGGEPVPANLLEDLARVSERMPEGLEDLLEGAEVQAIVTRIGDLLDNPVFPEVTSQRQYPWPVI